MRYWKDQNNIVARCGSSMLMFVNDTKLKRRIKIELDCRIIQLNLEKLEALGAKQLLYFTSNKCEVMSFRTEIMK